METVKIIEVEMRGPLSESQLLSLSRILPLKGKFVERKERVLIDYSTLMQKEAIEDRKVDIRLRNTNNVSEIIIKTGSWGASDIRREYSVKSDSSFDTLVQVYLLLGYTKGVLCVRNIDVYKYSGIEIAIVEVPGHSYFFEAEIELTEEEGVEVAQDKLREVLKSLDLKVYSDSGYFDYIATLNEDANIVFDARKESEHYFANTFSI